MPFSRSAFSGFPFDRDFQRDSRDDSFRSQLDDLAQRHPEFAEHLEGFGTLGRRSRPPRPDDSEFRRFTGRPFGSSRFERFGFPFGRDPFEDDYERFEERKPPQPETSQEQKPQEEQPEEQKRGRRHNIQQSNTVDLGQKQEPVNERNQRSMSAPPPDNRGQQRYVSSINIPIGGMGDMGAKQSQPPSHQSNKPMERVIPIHVEGRDEPVMPKHAGPSFSQSQPQPETIFSQRPLYTGARQFAEGADWHHPGFAQPDVKQQKFQQHPPPSQQSQQQPQQSSQQQQQHQHQQKSEEQVSQPQQPSKHSNNPIDIIQLIQKDVSELMSQVEKFNGVYKDKQYLYLDEMLTRNLIKLDNIDTQGQENIRQARREAIKCIESCIGILEAKAAANAPKDKEPQETNVKEDDQREEPSQHQQESQRNADKMDMETKDLGNFEAVRKDEESKEEEKMDIIETTAVAESCKEGPETVETVETKPESQSGLEEDRQEIKLPSEEFPKEESDDKADTKKEKKKRISNK